MRIDLALQGVETRLEYEALLFFKRELDAERIPYLERDADHDGRADPDQRLQPDLVSQQREEPVRKLVGDPVTRHLHYDDQDEQQDLRVNAGLTQIAAHPAVDAEIDKRRERPDVFCSDEADNKSRDEPEQNIEWQGQVFMVQNGGN